MRGHAAKGDDRRRRPRRQGFKARGPERRCAGMACRWECGREEDDIGAGAPRGVKLPLVVTGGGNAQALPRVPVAKGKIARAQMNARSADLSGKRRVATDEQQKAVYGRDCCKIGGEGLAVRIVIVAQDDSGAWRQRGSDGTGVFDARAVGQEGEREKAFSS